MPWKDIPYCRGHDGRELGAVRAHRGVPAQGAPRASGGYYIML